MTVLRAEGLRRVFSTPAGDVVALDGVDLSAREGELVVVRGRSGAGKTTLLTLLGGLDRPTAGRVEIEGRDLAALTESQLADTLGDRVSSVFQTFGLVSVLSAAENVEVPLRVRRVDPIERDRRVREALESVGLADHAAQRPDELSGGQKQRLGLARALVGRPAVLLADEPTGQLDSETGASIMDLIAGQVHRTGMAAIVASHDVALIGRADRTIELSDGRAL